VSAALAAVCGLLVAAAARELWAERGERAQLVARRRLRGLRSRLPGLGTAAGAEPGDLPSRLRRAGLGDRTRPRDVVLARVACALSAMPPALLVAPAAPGRIAVVVLVGVPIAAAALPDLAIERLATRRRARIGGQLPDSLELIAREGARAFYEGDLAIAMAAHCREGDGMLTREDLRNYRAIEREPLVADIGDWHLASNPPPAVGGAMLTAMLLAFGGHDTKQWDSETLERLIETQRACLDFRQSCLDLADDVSPDALRLIDDARSGRLLSRWTSASTVHTSVVDDRGTGCAITASSGYGSGEMPAGTGLWLNNCLGEIELNRRGLDAGPVGARLPSNMAPSVARREGAVLAVGSPGADRITTAMQQFLINYLQFGMPLDAAIAHPRVHVDTSGDVPQLKAESGLDLPAVDLPTSIFPELSMYFGGVGVAVFDAMNGFDVAADPRREGGVYNPDAR